MEEPPRGRRDSEAGGGRFEVDEPFDDPFDITSTMHVPVDRLRRWRQAALVLNASCRFRYTLDLKKQEQVKIRLQKIRAHAQAIHAAQLFKAQGISKRPIPSVDFGISQEQLALMTRDRDVSTPGEYGGMFLWEAWQDLTLIILIIAAVASLVLGIKSEGIKEGRYDGGSIAFAVILVIVVTAISDYRESLQFQNLNEEKRNIHLEVVRGGGRVEVSIYDVVVGDVVSLILVIRFLLMES